MTKRYGTYDDYPTDGQRNARPQTRRMQEGTSRERVASSSHGRLDYNAQNRDHGHRVQQPRQKISAADYDRNRYSSHALRGQEQPRRQQMPQQSQRAAQQHQQPRAAQQGHAPQQMPPQGARRTPAPQYTGQFSRPDHNDKAMMNAASRYTRGNGMYQARPTGMETAANKAGAMTSPFSFLVRIVIIVVLVAVFGIRIALNSSTASQLADVQSNISTQQAALDELNSTNEQLQSSIDSRQDTIDKYNKIVQASS